MSTATHLAALADAAVFSIVLAAVLGLGWVAGRRGLASSLSDYAAAGGRAPWWAALASILAAETSAATLLGVPAEGLALGDYRPLQALVGMVAGRCAVAALFVPRMHGRGAISVYAFLGARFGALTRRAAGAVFLLTRLAMTGTRAYVGAIVLAVAIRLVAAVPLGPTAELAVYATAALCLCALTALYTARGGMRAVLWTDTLQSVVTLAAIAGTLACLLHTVGLAPLRAARWVDLGGTPGGDLATTARSILRAPYTLYAGVLGALITTLATHGADQDIMQRVLATADVRRGRRALALSGICEIPVLVALTSVGILLRACVSQLPHATGRPASEVFVIYILTALPPGLRGLMCAATMATSMGSLSAALNALATAYVHDLAPRVEGEASTVRRSVGATWVAAALLAALAVGSAALVQWRPTLRIMPLALGAFGLTYGPLLAIFLWGLTTERGRDRAAATSLGLGIVGTAGLQAWLAPSLYWRVPLGALCTGVVAWCLTRRRDPLVYRAGPG